MTAPATTRATWAAGQRNVAFAKYDQNLRALTRYQLGGVLGPAEFVRIATMAGDLLVARLDELDVFEAKEQPSRLIGGARG